MIFPVGRGSAGPNVALIQDRLNRLGALLTADGQFGAGTEEAVRDARARLNLPSDQPTVDAVLWAALDALPEPSPLLPTRGVVFIAMEEIGSRRSYDQTYRRPSWPGGESGITIGIGYDLRFASLAAFQTDWQAGLSAESSAALLPWLGKRATVGRMPPNGFPRNNRFE